MAEFVSEIKSIPYSDMDVYTVLSDLKNLEYAKDRIPQDKVKEFTFDTDFCSIAVDPIGRIKFVVVNREPNSVIKFEAEQVPFGVTIWIQLESASDSETKMKLTINADLNPFIKPMVAGPLQQGLDKIADVLAVLPYDKILKKGIID